jgi:hypothetical protein
MRPVPSFHPSLRVEALRRLIARPEDALVVARIVPWALVLPVLKYLIPLPALARLMWARPVSNRRDRDRERRVVSLVRAFYRSRALGRDENCLERSLLTYRSLSRLGADPRLVAGLGRKSSRLVGHAWVTVDGEPVGEPAAASEDLARVVVFGPGGATEPVA